MSDRDRVMLAALRWLRRHDRFEADLEARLMAAGFKSGLIQDVLADLRRRRILDDARLAEDAINQRAFSKLQGKHKIQSDLEMLGARPEDIENLLSALESSETDRARQLATKQADKGADPIKIARYLSSRGFDEETVRSVLELDDLVGSSDNSS